MSTIHELFTIVRRRLGGKKEKPKQNDLDDLKGLQEAGLLELLKSDPEAVLRGIEGHPRWNSYWTWHHKWETISKCMRNLTYEERRTFLGAQDHENPEEVDARFDQIHSHFKGKNLDSLK